MHSYLAPCSCRERSQKEKQMENVDLQILNKILTLRFMEKKSPLPFIMHEYGLCMVNQVT